MPMSTRKWNHLTKPYVFIPSSHKYLARVYYGRHYSRYWGYNSEWNKVFFSRDRGSIWGNMIKNKAMCNKMLRRDLVSADEFCNKRGQDGRWLGRVIEGRSYEMVCQCHTSYQEGGEIQKISWVRWPGDMDPHYTLLTKGSFLLGTLIFKILGRPRKLRRFEILNNWKEISQHCLLEGQVFCFIGKQERTTTLEAERPKFKF